LFGDRSQELDPETKSWQGGSTGTLSTPGIAEQELDTSTHLPGMFLKLWTKECRQGDESRQV
jgi:alpha-D-ribose 1-methylphosphonate 5-triphosphate synthase subunit PhnH